MAGTNFPDGVSSMGVPLNAGGSPYSSLVGSRGKALFVAPYRTASSTANQGSDANDGLSLASPLKTISAAYAKCDGNKGEVIYLLSSGSNTAADVTDDWSATFTWSKNAVHLIGLCPPVAVSHRARINQLSTATAVSPLLDVTGNNCVFANFQIFQGVADATSLINVRVTGQRNVFDNVHIAGVGHATMSAAGACSLSLNGGDENVFNNCVIGLDTIARDADTSEIRFDTDASRNRFRDCLIQGFISAAGYTHATVTDATGIDRWTIFERCIFLSESANDATAQTAIFSLPAMSQGYILLRDCVAYTPTASTDWDANNRGRIHANMGDPTAAAAGGLGTKQ